MRWVRTALLVAVLLTTYACAQRRATDARADAPPAQAAPAEPSEPAPPPTEPPPAEPSGLTAPEPAAPEPAGNERKTAEIAKTPEEVQIVEQLHRTNADIQVAKTVKADKKKLIPLMRLALRHEAPNVRSQAARVIVRVGESSPETTAAWIEALRAEAVPEIVANWCYDLRLYKAPEVAPVLLELLRTQPDSSARQALAETLGALQYAPALDDIVKMLKAPETMERLSALAALKRLMLPGATDAVRELAENDPNQVVRGNARDLLTLLEKK